tara:strand:+ start:1061 stop:3454 length:2394 start_codon:yes stop_codon:yes gene_type:complete
MSAERIQGKFSNLKVFEATVVDVNQQTGDIYIVTGDYGEMTDPDIIPPIYYGGISGTGLFQHPEKGDTVICVKVHPGGKGITQGIRVIPKASRVADSESVTRNSDGRSRPGTPEYPITGLKPGEVKLRGLGGKLDITGEGERGSGITAGTISGSGLYVRKNSSTDSAISLVGNSLKIANDSTRISSRNIYRYVEGDPERLNKVSANDYIEFQSIDGGKRRGLFPGSTASTSAVLGGIRNPGLSEYRFVANEFSETEYFLGWDLESRKRDQKSIDKFTTSKQREALSYENSLHMGPHQIVEVIIGNVANSRGEVLDPNYNPVVLGNASGMPSGSSLNTIYEEARLKSRRGIGYHFQVSTNSLSTDVSNSGDNFILSIDKEGVLKGHIPASSDTGNIMYPASASFYSESSGKIKSSYSFSQKKEKIPITLRYSGQVLYPPLDEAEIDAPEEDEIPVRYTGVRFSNENKYFKGFTDTSEDPSNVRVNPTKYHNMYAAAEMLIANKIRKINIPLSTSECTGYIPGNPIGKSFEIKTSDKLGVYGAPKYMATVAIAPDSPAIDTGGGVFVAGQNLSLDQDESLRRINLQYTNGFSLSEGDSGISATNATEDGESRKKPGGKSANMTLDGSLELSVGKDNYDQKSILLDTAGAMIAWFGRDRNNRSLVMQTDGDVLMNIGGPNGNEWNAGRFDLRVNVSNKGFVGEEDEGVEDSDYIISISENGLVIAGMKKSTPMIIRNDGNLMIESASKLILSGQNVSIREGNRPERKTDRAPVSSDTPDATIEGVADQIGCLAEKLSDNS